MPTVKDLELQSAGVKRLRDDYAFAVMQSQLMIQNAQAYSDLMSNAMSCSTHAVQSYEKAVLFQERLIKVKVS